MNESTQTNLTYGPARVLLGWMEENDAVRVQQDGRVDVEVSSEARERFRMARSRVDARRRGVDQHDLISPLPKTLDPYLDHLRTQPAMEPTFAEGWEPALVDLRRVCAFQPRVYLEHADERVRAVDAGDLESIARVSLPNPNATSFPAFFDPAREAWVISSPDPNIKVIGHFGRQLAPDVAGFGFSVVLNRSFVSVMEYRGRHYLTDGYHRSVAFLRRGITHVPALTRTLPDDQAFRVPSGMLPTTAYLGERPPQLADFLEDEVSLAVVMPVYRKIIVIQALTVMA